MSVLNKLLATFAVLAVIGTLCAYAAEYTKFSSSFVKKFKDCERYQETITSEFEGKKFTTERRILGWQNGMCLYHEVISSPNDKYKLHCALTELQVDELYRAMKSKSKASESFELDLYAEQTDLKTGKKTFVKDTSTKIFGNKAYIAWAKIQNNPYFCLPEKLTK
ncbi:MAG: hypothetical protein NC191_08305 [Muribaculaceae bacterium]|nr:hypothetical protein [Muribaculaceae bacterium]